ncbi:MAG: Oligoendopeptidase F, plasmid [Phycisphaerae bacterium]|nr:Oligoendopeptidase F, plasmid [Phycisphaerae bacterium]
MVSLTMTAAWAEEPATGEVAERSAIAEQYKWDLSVMYKTPADWDTHYGELDKMITELAGLKGTPGSGPEALAKVLALRDQVNVQLEKLYAYAMMKHHEDMREAAPQATLQRAETLAQKYGEATAWLMPELVQIPQETVNSWLTRDDLKVYGHFFDDLYRQQKHILSPREEELLAMSGQAVGATDTAYEMLSGPELRLRKITVKDDKEIEVSDPVFYESLESKDREYRAACFKAYHQGYLDVRNALAATLAGTVHGDWYNAKARGYTSSLQASLDAENLPVEVYHNLIKTVNDNIPLLQRYSDLKKKQLGITDGLHFYDLYVNLVDKPEKSYTFDEAREMILAGLKPLGDDYLAVMKTGFESRWLDVFENKGKQHGAYNMGTYLSPPYVLLNYKGTFDGVSTVAHEMGHAMQSWFAKENQPPVYGGYPMFTAEVASTTAEIVFKQQMLKQMTDPREKAWLINQMLEDIRRTVFRQTQFAEFDLWVHELAEKGEPITADAMLAKTKELYQKYYGPDFVIDPELEVESLRISHYYRNYYVYRYATSLSASAALAKNLLDATPGARDNYMKFLKIGNSMYALDMLKVAGVDMTSPKPIEDCMALFGDLLGQLEKLLAEQTPAKAS